MGDAVGLVVLAVAVVASMLIGVGRIWPGGERGTGTRVVLLLLNLGAASVLFVAWFNASHGSADYHRGWDEGYEAASGVTADGVPVEEKAGIYSEGRWVTNIYPYDASGKPLTGVQLFDQDGKPIDAAPHSDCASTSADPLPRIETDENGVEMCVDENTGELLPTRVAYPWMNGSTQLYNVFPLPSRMQDGTAMDPNAFTGEDAPAVEEPPLEDVPEASLPSGSPSTSPSTSPGAAENP